MKQTNTKLSKWTSTLMQLNLLFIFSVFVLEIIFTVYDAISGDSFWNLFPEALFALLPSVINLVLYLLGCFFLRIDDPTYRIVRYTPILVSLLCCTNLASWYNIYPVCKAIFLIPVFITVIFTNKRMTAFITLLAMLLLAGSDCLIAFLKNGSSGFPDSAMLPELLLNVCILLAAFMVARVIIDCMMEKNTVITEGLDTKNRLTEELKRDHLTGLYNLSTYETLMNEYTFEAWSNHTPLCMAIIDIDNFKKVNDNYGHAQGNAVLIALAKLLQKYCSNGEAAARYGGEEFIIFFPNTGLATASVKLNTIRQAFSEIEFSFLPPGEHITFSSGLAPYPGNEYSNSYFFELADKALYRAKASGKNCVIVEDKKI